MDGRKNIWIIANWKSNKTVSETLEWISIVGPQLPQIEGLKVVVCPSFTALNEIKKSISNNSYPLLVGAQNISPFPAGAYTGEVAASTISDTVDLAIVGHSERRQHFAETDQVIEDKVQLVLKSDITPLVCVQGVETPIPDGVSLVAYEPIFAIGTGNPDTPENAAIVAQQLKDQKGSSLEILYGGSINGDNAKQFLVNETLNGLLIGKSSLDPIEFTKIVMIASSVLS